MLKIDQLSYTIKKKIILKDVTLELEPGIYAFLGPTGSGKSLLFSLIATHITPQTGSIKLNDEIIYEHPLMLKEVLFLNPNFISMMESARTIESYFTYLATKMAHFDINQAYEFARKFDLNIGNGTIDALSLGQKALVTAIIGLSSKHQIILLDAIYHGMDYHVRKEFNQYLYESQKTNDTIIIVTTELKKEIETIIDYYLLIKEGSIDKVAYTGEL